MGGIEIFSEQRTTVLAQDFLLSSPPTRRRLCAALLATSILFAFSGQSMADTPSGVDHGAQPHCTGRFDYRLPAALRSSGSQQSLYRVNVEAVGWPHGLGAADVWRQRLAETIAHPASAVLLSQREFELPGVGPAAWMRLTPARPDLATLLAMKPVPGSNASLFLRVDGATGRESVAQDVASQVAASYTPGSPNGFCAGPGAFVIAPSKNERALESFTAPGIEVSIQTETVSAPDDGSSTDGDPLPGVQRLSKHPRRVAGFDGIEERTRITQPGAPTRLVHVWIFPGLAANGAAPRIRLAATGIDSRTAALDAAWEMLLDSWHQRPVGVR
jgi:hypothetical protein